MEIKMRIWTLKQLLEKPEISNIEQEITLMNFGENHWNLLAFFSSHKIKYKKAQLHYEVTWNDIKKCNITSELERKLNTQNLKAHTIIKEIEIPVVEIICQQPP